MVIFQRWNFRVGVEDIRESVAHDFVDTTENHLTMTVSIPEVEPHAVMFDRFAGADGHTGRG
ncbi:hypothetical protein A9C11_33560 (plasmid) [Pseudomonas citronellolis]|uniref:Uncharacterized protein n=1 Tax=Pseudomonas citronellolis TaxID=53408 RepID=A0A1A9KN85_9PSED|nr:hypothetical protein A9C11_33560 [Pseudomonas citronellolis]KWR86555.1 hypothetical protein RN02_00845 [Pseudomonas sp. PI1]